MFDWEYYKYALVASIISIILIGIFSPQYFWPWSIVVFGLELGGIYLSNWLVKVVTTRHTESKYLAPGFILYRRYFATALTIYLFMGVFSYVENVLAIVYFSLFVIGFMGIGLSILVRIMVGGDLLDEYKDPEDKE